VAEVVEELERWYSVRFEIATPALAERHLSVTFRTTDRIEDALDVITTSLPGTTAQRRGSTIVISSAPPR
ncbi:MAG: DUF4974 domain-containing protein, partial [Gemmatimonadota bacterium]